MHTAESVHQAGHDDTRVKMGAASLHPIGFGSKEDESGLTVAKGLLLGIQGLI